jgi:hypothetical protein
MPKNAIGVAIGGKADITIARVLKRSDVGVTIQKRGDGKNDSGNNSASPQTATRGSTSVLALSSVSNRKPQFVQDQKLRTSCSSLKYSTNSGAITALLHSPQIVSHLELRIDSAIVMVANSLSASRSLHLYFFLTLLCYKVFDEDQTGLLPHFSKLENMPAFGPKRTCTSALQMSAFGVRRTWRESISISAKDPKRAFGRHLGPRMRRMMPAYPALLDAVVFSSGHSIITVGSVGEFGWWGFLITSGQGH